METLINLKKKLLFLEKELEKFPDKFQKIQKELKEISVNFENSKTPLNQEEEIIYLELMNLKEFAKELHKKLIN